MNSRLTIQSLQLDSRLILAPLAGYTDLPFRLLCRQFGAGLCYTEMISCHGLVYQKDKTLRLARTVQDERPVALQLFGADPAMMGQAAAIVSELAIDIVDINMGCPVKKVVKKGAGAALMKNRQLAAAVITEVRRNTTMPVTIKIRTGWNHESITAPEFARMAEDLGVSAVAVHGRTWSQGFGGGVDWQTISQVKKNVSIPVIGNGDVVSHAMAEDLLRETGCDAIMIGRGALGNPWIFSPAGTPDSLTDRLAVLKRHLMIIREFDDPGSMLSRIKNLAGRYFKGITGGSAIRRHIYQAGSFDELLQLIESL